MKHRRPIASALAACALAAGAASAADPVAFEGRLHLQHDSFDGVYADDGERHGAGYPRRARLGASLRLPQELKFAFDFDLDRGGRSSLHAASLEWRGWPAGTLRIGRFDPDFGLEQAVSSNWTSGIERSAVWDLSADVADIGEGHGLQFDATGERLYASLGAFDKPDAQGWVARSAFAPLREATRVLHLGVSLAAEQLDDENGRIRTRLGVRGVSESDAGQRATLADKLPGGGRYTRHRLAAVELAAVHGPWSLQAEALQRRLGGGGSPPRSARGAYVQLAWTLTGESRPYKIEGAKFGRMDAADPRLGAWELVVRHDWLAASGAALGKGRARVALLGLNWYARRWLRVSANALRAQDALGEAGNAASLRVQLMF